MHPGLGSERGDATGLCQRDIIVSPGFSCDSVDHTREVREALCHKTLSLSARDGLVFCQNADGEDSSQCGWGRVPENRTEKRGHPCLSPGLAQGPLRLEPLETKQPGGS